MTRKLRVYKSSLLAPLSKQATEGADILIMPVTFAVTPVAPEPVRLQSYRGDHYLEHHKAFRKAGCGTILRETPWDPLRTGSGNNGLVWGVIHAYNNHHKLTLRPDDVWLAIAIQFGLFVNANAEQLRGCFVAHEGRKTLTVRQAADLNTADYAGLLSRDMIRKMRNAITDAEVCDWILPDFSTTTDDDRVVGSVVLMASMKAYFEYKIHLCCGIPEVTLLGTPEDWDAVHKRVGKLRTYGKECTQWADMLQTITGNMARSARNDVPLDFWQRICHYTDTGSGPSYVSGWISAFCVFDEDGKWQGSNTTLTAENGEVIHGLQYPVIETADIPPGFITTDIEIDDDGKKHQALLFAGHAVYETPAEDTIAPKLSWALVLKDKSSSGEKRPRLQLTKKGSLI